MRQWQGDSMMVTGCSQDSNCAASTRYMKIALMAIATKNPFTMRPVSLVSPAGLAL